jgi:hypothetical protein
MTFFDVFLYAAAAGFGFVFGVIALYAAAVALIFVWALAYYSIEKLRRK